MVKRLAKKVEVLIGISSGAAVQVVLGVGNKGGNSGKLFIVIIPTCGEDYLFTPLTR